MQWLRRYVGPKGALIAGCAGLILALGASLAGLSVMSREAVRETAAQAAQAMATAAAPGAARAILSFDALLIGTAQELSAAGPPTALDGPEAAALLRRAVDENPQIGNLLLYDRDGRLANAARASSEPDKPALRAIFSAQAGPGSPGLVIGMPQRDPASGRWSLLASRPLNRAGQFAGIVAAEIPVAALIDLAPASPRAGLGLGLLFADGTLVGAGGGDATRLGPSLIAAANRRDSGIVDIADGADRSLVGFRRVPGRPLIALAAIDEAELFDGWRRQRRWTIGAFLAFALAGAAFTAALVRRLDRHDRRLAVLRRNEARFGHQSQLLQNTLNHMGEGLSVFDRDGGLIAWNDRFLSLLALPGRVGVGTRLEDILRLQARRGDFGPVEIESEVLARLARFRASETQLTERATLAGRLLEIRRRRMPSGGYVALYSDITERKRAEQEMIDARNQSEIANRSKSEFLANMSHELRTPLNAIIGFSDIMRHEKFGAMANLKYLEYARDIHNSGLHLLDLINDVLDMSKIEAGKFELFPEQVVIAELVAACLTMVRERARERRIRIAADLGTQPVVVWADLRAMKQILLNLLSNAVKFSRESGAVTIAAGLDAAGGAIITVSDTGIGMTDEQIERARQPFGQAHASTTSTYGGTGLGLPITQRLIELHGGRLHIASRPGDGTTVMVSLPASRVLRTSLKRA